MAIEQVLQLHSLFPHCRWPQYSCNGNPTDVSGIKLWEVHEAYAAKVTKIYEAEIVVDQLPI